MSDTGKAIVGLVIFLAVVSVPFWYSRAAGDTTGRPELAKPRGEACVKDKQWMTSWHMDLLNQWRDEVVRQEDRFIELGGQRYEKSLTKTCLSCHADRATFCDRCHTYSGVDPYCWDCHLDLEGE